MAKRKRETDQVRPPQPIVYTMDYSFPITLVAFREKDAVERVRHFGAALAALMDAGAPEMFVLGDATLKVRSAEPLPLEQP